MDNFSIVIRRGDQEVMITSVPVDFFDNLGKPNRSNPVDTLLKIMDNNKASIELAVKSMVYEIDSTTEDATASRPSGKAAQ